MKKGVIVSKETDQAIAVTSRGEFCKVPIKGTMEIGDEIPVKPSAKFMMALIVAVFLGLNVCGWGIYGGVSTYRTPVTFVAVDINPSVEFTLNRAKKVMSVKGNNHDGKLLIAGESFKGLTVDQAVSKVMSLAAKAGYFDFDKPEYSSDPAVVPNAVMLTVANDDETDCRQVKDAAQSAASSYFDSMGMYALILMENFSKELWVNCEKYGVDLGKMKLVELAVAEGVALEEAKGMSVKALNAVLAKAHRDTQAELDSATLIEERQGKFSQYLQQFLAQENEIKSSSASVFAGEKLKFLNETVTLRYKMCEEWEAYKTRWRNQRELISA